MTVPILWSRSRHLLSSYLRHRSSSKFRFSYALYSKESSNNQKEDDDSNDKPVQFSNSSAAEYDSLESQWEEENDYDALLGLAQDATHENLEYLLLVNKKKLASSGGEKLTPEEEMKLKVLECEYVK